MAFGSNLVEELGGRLSRALDRDLELPDLAAKFNDLVVLCSAAHVNTQQVLSIGRPGEVADGDQMKGKDDGPGKSKESKNQGWPWQVQRRIPKGR